MPCWTQDTGNVLSSFGCVLCILCFTDFELLFKVVILMFESILLIILCIHVIRKRLPWLLLLQSLCLLSDRVLVMALHLIMANIPLVLGVLVVLNTLDIDELLDITRLLHLLVVRLCAGLSVPHECFPQLLIHKIVVDTSTELSSELLMNQLLCLLVLRLSRY